MLFTRKKVLKFIKEHGLLTPGDKVIVAYSGGADSMALLDILANLPDFPLQLVLAHLNHCLRGDESDRDESFVRAVAEKYALPLEITRVNVASLAQERGLSLEEAGRDARRSFFHDIAENQAAVAVALGHHRDDQAETVLMRLIRGAAGSGLRGIQPGSDDDLFVRPLLSVDRSNIEQYLHKRGLQWREDSSNSNTKFLRNRIRHELLPLLKSYNPGIAGLLNRTAQALSADEEILEALTCRVFAETVSLTANEVRIDLQTLLTEPEALRKRVYRKSVYSLKGDLRRISSDHLAKLDSLALAKKGSGSLVMPCGINAQREYGRLIFKREMDKNPAELWEVTVDQCGSYDLPFSLTLSVELMDGLPPDWQETGPDTVFAASDQLPFPWSVRFFRDGDRFAPLGMTGRKKLKDLFIDRKIPHLARRRIPLLLSEREIFWVAGVQLARKAAVSDSAGGVFRLMVMGEATGNRH